MMIYEYGAAKARVKRNRVLEVQYTGPMDLPAAMALGWEANRLVRKETKLVRVDQALFCFQESAPLEDLRKMGEGKFGVILCRPDQYQVTRGFCDALALLGLVRVASLDLEAARSLALAFASLTR